MWFQKVLDSQAVRWWKELAVLAVHAYIFGIVGKTDCGGTISDDSGEVLSCRNGCQGEKAVTETFNEINIR
jgi:hypothetical protein